MFQFDREKFFSHFRFLFGPLTQGQVDGLNFLLPKLEQDKRLQDINLIAYILATIKHETAHTFQPISEYGSKERFISLYGPATSVGKRLGNLTDADAVAFHGRGYVQLTGRRNYTRAQKEIGANFVAKPNLAQKPNHAYEILVQGMIEGWFGKRVGDFIRLGSLPDFEGARQAVNDHDRAGEIAEIARKMAQVLRYSALNGSPQWT
jgi:putative chitinase